MSAAAAARAGCGWALCLLVVCRSFAAVPAPRTYFGHEMGADRTVLDWSKVVSYFQALAAASDRIRLEQIGSTVEGRPMIAATIAEPETLRRLDRYLAIQQKLADPRRTPQAEADRLAVEGKAVVLITCSIHATEIASTHTAVEFAHRILTEDTPRLRAILKDTIFLLVPSLNPDGVDIVTRWYRKTVGTPFEGTSPPELYHKYVGHDNNRDWYIFSQPETRATISKLHNVWHPQIVYDVHQQGPYASRIFVPPWLDPTEPNVDAILMQETNMIGTAIAADLTAAGKTGVAIHAAYDFWTPSRHYQAFHGGMRILTESASARIASPVQVKPEEIDRTQLGYLPRERSWNYLEPWLGGTWRLRDIVDYQLIAWESCLYNAAIHREELLRAFYRVGQRQTSRKSPWGFVVTGGQRDPGATDRLLETLRYGQVEIEKGSDGSAVIPMHQPYSGWAKALLERQHYPNDLLYPGGPPKRPYDVTAHTLPLLMGVKVDAVDRPVATSGAWERTPRPQGSILSATDTDTWVAVNRAWKEGTPVWRNPLTGEFSVGRGQPAWKQIPRPRVALYQGWVPSMDEGWTRWMLDQFGFAYASVRPKEIQTALHDRFDVIVFADQPATTIESGYAPGTMPAEYVGGVGQRGAEELKAFAEAGGTLVFLNSSTEFALHRLGIQARNAVARATQAEMPATGGSGQYYSPGSLLNSRVQNGHPLTLGMPTEITIWSEHSPAWDTQLPSPVRYPEAGILASGWLLGEKLLAGRSALVDAPVGRGHVVLFGMRPQYRAQSYLTLKMFFNALVYR